MTHTKDTIKNASFQVHVCVFVLANREVGCLLCADIANMFRGRSN
jgi:hypothetical protein